MLAGIDAALRIIDAHPSIERVLTIGGDCSVSVAPFAWLANKYGEDLAVVWIDSHPDVDTIDADEVALGLGRVPGGLTTAQVHRLIADQGQAADVVGLTVAEFLPRELLALGAVLAGLPLVAG